MADQAVTDADSTVAAGTDATQAPAVAPASDPSSQTAADAQPSTEPAQEPFQLDEELVKKYEATQAFQEKYVPKAVFTQKTQALADERRRMEAEKAAIFELARKAIADKPAQVGPTAEDQKRKELQDLAAAGDSQALQTLIQMEAERQMQPVKTQVALQNAAQNARASSPYVVKHWNEIIQTMQNDPVIAKLATMDNYAAADRVMIALGLEHQVRELVPQLQTTQKENEALKAKIAAYEKERAAGLPSSTSRAGTTAGRPAAGDAQDIKEAALRAWKEMGFPESEFR